MKNITLLFRGLRYVPLPSWCGDTFSVTDSAVGYSRLPLFQYSRWTNCSARSSASCRSTDAYQVDSSRVGQLEGCRLSLNNSYALFTNIRLSRSDELKFVKSEFRPSSSPSLHWSERINGLQRWITSSSRCDKTTVRPCDTTAITVIIASRRGKAYSHAGVCYNGMLFELVVEDGRDVALYQSVSLADFLESSEVTDRCYVLPVLYGDFLSSRSAFNRRVINNNIPMRLHNRFGVDDFMRIVKEESAKDYQLCSHNCWDFVSAILRKASSAYALYC